MKELRSSIQKMLSERYPNNVIVNDGILDINVFKEQKVKVLFLLKETYGGYIDINGPQKIKNGKSVPFWPNIYNWTKLANDMKKGEKPEHLSKNEIIKIDKYVDNIAYVNIKKIEGFKKSNNKDILSHAKKDRDILQYQINTINPDVIYVSDLKHYKTIFELKDLMRFDYKKVFSGKMAFEAIIHNDRRIIKIHHPSYLKNQKETFNSMIEMFNELY